MAAHFGNRPVTFFELMLNAARRGRESRLSATDDPARWTGGHFTLNFSHKTRQERFDQFFRLGRLTFFFRVDDRDDTIAMHHFFICGGGMK